MDLQEISRDTGHALTNNVQTYDARAEASMQIAAGQELTNEDLNDGQAAKEQAPFRDTIKSKEAGEISRNINKISRLISHHNSLASKRLYPIMGTDKEMSVFENLEASLTATQAAYNQMSNETELNSRVVSMLEDDNYA